VLEYLTHLNYYSQLLFKVFGYMPEIKKVIPKDIATELKKPHSIKLE